MSQVRIKLLQDQFTRGFVNDEDIMITKLRLAKNGYLILPRMDARAEGGEAAEEMFNLTNNPSRQVERLQRYGNGRSVSSGDIVEVDGVNYLCCSIGWEKLELNTNTDGHDI